jgi:aryl-alcohol dehydrogenase
MRIRAAIVPRPGEAFEIRDAELDEPMPHELVVRIVATGLCHTDLVARDGHLGFPFPAVLGHEGAGIVERVGSMVSKVREGDPVVMTFPHCGECAQCQLGRPTYCPMTQRWIFSGRGRRASAFTRAAGVDLGSSFMGQSSFASHALTTQEAVVKIRTDVPLEMFGPMGCSFQTGAGTVLRAFGAPFGATLAVFGCGPVGLAAVMAARASGLSRIIAVDLLPARLALAHRLGATDTVDGRTEDPVERIRDMTGARGADFAIWAVGATEVIPQAVASLAQTGVCALLGVAPGAQVTLPVHDLFKGKTVRGVLAGDSVPDVLIPQLIDLYAQGRFPIDEMVRFYDFEDINVAAADMLGGVTVKPVLRL